MLSPRKQVWFVLPITTVSQLIGISYQSWKKEFFSFVKKSYVAQLARETLRAAPSL